MNLKRFIAASIVCFKPQIFLTICILVIIVHSILIVIRSGVGMTWRTVRPIEISPTVFTMILFGFALWISFMLLICRTELQTELESVLVLFQCSKRGLRLLGVVVFHIAFVAIVSWMVSGLVNRSLMLSKSNREDISFNSMAEVDINYFRNSNRVQLKTPSKVDVYSEEEQNLGDINYETIFERKFTMDKQTNFSTNSYPAKVYKIWLTAVIYCFLYVFFENVIMFHTDMTLVEFVHAGFLNLVTKLTGVDLSDYPAGEMLFNPLVRRRII